MYALEHLDQYGGQVQQNGRVSYRLLQMRLRPDEERNDDLKYASIDIQQVTAEKDRKMLVEKVDQDALARLRLCEGHRTVVVMKGRGNRPLLLACLPEGYGAVGDPAEGFQAVVEALALVDKNRERRSEAELDRPNADLLLDHERGTKGPGGRKAFRCGLSLR